MLFVTLTQADLCPKFPGQTGLLALLWRQPALPTHLLLSYRVGRTHGFSVFLPARHSGATLQQVGLGLSFRAWADQAPGWAELLIWGPELGGSVPPPSSLVRLCP